MTTDYIEQIVEQIKAIDTTDLSDDVSKDPLMTIIEEQKIYFWIRLYLKDENPNIETGDDIIISHSPSEEELKTKFICYGKNNLQKDHVGEVINYDPEDDKKVLCLMIDEKMVNGNEDIPFIRTLFKTGHHYEYQLVKRDELLFIIEKNNVVLEYFDVDF